MLDIDVLDLADVGVELHGIVMTMKSGGLKKKRQKDDERTRDVES